MKDGDIITGVNGKKVRDGNDLVNTVTATPIGSPVSIAAIRDGKQENFKVVVGDLTQVFPESFGGAKAEEPKAEKTEAKFGMSIQNLTISSGRIWGSRSMAGYRLDPSKPIPSPKRSALAPKDVLLSINRTPVNNVDDVRRIQNTLKPGDAVALRILRQDRGSHEWNAEFVAGTLPNNPQ